MRRKGRLRELFNLQGGLCAYCGTKMDINKCNTPNAPTLDHILPKSLYKSLAQDNFNLVCACRQCNNEKGSMPLSHFLVQLQYRDRELVA